MGWRVQHNDTLVVLLGDRQLAVPTGIRMGGARDVVRGAGSALRRRNAGLEWVKWQVCVERDIDVGGRAFGGVAGAVACGERHRRRDQRAGAAALAERKSARIEEVAASHASMVSHPEAVTQLILSAVEETAAAGREDVTVVPAGSSDPAPTSANRCVAMNGAARVIWSAWT